MLPPPGGYRNRAVGSPTSSLMKRHRVWSQKHWFPWRWQDQMPLELHKFWEERCFFALYAQQTGRCIFFGLLAEFVECAWIRFDCSVLAPVQPEGDCEGFFWEKRCHERVWWKTVKGCQTYIVEDCNQRLPTLHGGRLWSKTAWLRQRSKTAKFS